MQGWATGERVAMSTLVRRYTPRLRAYFQRVGRETPDDLVQQTFMKLHAARARYQPSLPFRAWIFTIAAHERIDAYRRSGRTQLADNLDESADVAGVCQDDAVWRRELSAMLTEAVDALPPSQREVLHLHYIEGLGFAEIARALGTTENAIKQCAFRAYSQLRVRLAGLRPDVLQ